MVERGSTEYGYDPDIMSPSLMGSPDTLALKGVPIHPLDPPIGTFFDHLLMYC